MILVITNKIRERDPELLKYMNEMPLTVPYQENPEITGKTLKSYCESLVVIFEEYKNNGVGEGSIPVIFLHGFPFDKWMLKVYFDNLKSLSAAEKMRQRHT